jgi:hypothetical protein
MKINDVILPEGLLGEKVTTCLLQLRSPFYREAAMIRALPHPIIGWVEPFIQERESRLEQCLQRIGLFERHVDMLVLPEYSVAEGTINILGKFSQNNHCLVVGTYYHSADRKARTFVVYPQGESYKVETGFKCHRSIFEVDVLQETNPDEQIFLRLNWRIGDENLKILVLSCLDFLSWPDLPPDFKEADILTSPMCSPNMKEFLAIAGVAMRWEPDNSAVPRSRACILCNAVDLVGGGIGACGGTQVIGVSRVALPSLPLSVEGGLIADINCLSIIKKPTPIGGSERHPVEGTALFLLDADWNVHWQATPERPRRGNEINPGAPARLGLHRYYLFAKMKNYWKHRHDLDKMSVGCSAIYGFHDILLYSHEESIDLLKLRVQASCSQSIWQDIEAREQDCFRVTGVIKFRGRLFASINTEAESGYYRMDSLNQLGHSDLNQGLHDVVNASKGDVAALRRALESGVLLDGIDVSDVPATPEARSRMEYLVLVWLLQDSTRGLNPGRIFEEFVVNPYLSMDERVRTIEICEPAVPVSAGFLQAHYILHIVGHKDDLSEIVIDRIHQTLGKHRVDCGTRVLPVAETRCLDQYSAFNEGRTNDSVVRQRICELIVANLQERQPFVFKMPDDDVIERFANTWQKGLQWLDKRDTAGHDRNEIRHSRAQLARCLYSICCALIHETSTYDNEMRSHMWNYCGSFYRVLAGEIESYLSKCLHNKADNHGNCFWSQLQQVWQSGTKKHELKEFMDPTKLSLGNIMQAVIYWNTHAGQQSGFIIDKDVTQSLQKVQGMGLVDFRDCFMHPCDSKDSAMDKHLVDKKGAKRLLLSIEEGLGFLLAWKYRA